MAQRKPRVGSQFPVQGIYEPIPAVVTAPGGGNPIGQIVRWSGRMGWEGMAHLALFGTSDVGGVPVVGPVPGLTMQAFAAPASTIKGSTNRLSPQETASVGKPVSLSQGSGVTLGIPLNFPMPWTLARNVFVPKNQMILFVISWDVAAVPAGTKFWGYIFGTTWIVGQLTPAQLVAQQLHEATL